MSTTLRCINCDRVLGMPHWFTDHVGPFCEDCFDVVESVSGINPRAQSAHGSTTATEPGVVKQLLTWAEAEREEWSERNADRYWQMGRVVSQIKKLQSASHGSAPEAPPDNALAIASAELAWYQDGFEGLPSNPTFKTSDENLAYTLWFGKSRKVRADLVDKIDTLSRLLKQASGSAPEATADRQKRPV